MFENSPFGIELRPVPVRRSRQPMNSTADLDAENEFSFTIIGTRNAIT
jgi:hypothetical protein